MEHQENRKLNCKNIWIPLLFAVLFLALVLISSCQLYQSGLLRDELGYRYEAVFYNGIGSVSYTHLDVYKRQRESLDESLPVLKNNFVISLLGGYVVRPDEIDKNFSYFGIGLSRTGPVFVCVIKLNELNASTGEHYLPLQIHSLTAMVMDLLAEEFSDSGSYLFCNSCLLYTSIRPHRTRGYSDHR